MSDSWWTAAALIAIALLLWEVRGLLREQHKLRYRQLELLAEISAKLSRRHNP